MDALLSHADAVRLAAFAGVLATLLALERGWPRRTLDARRAQRWPVNFAIVAIDTLVLRIAFPIAAVGAAAWAQRSGVGLLNAFEGPPAIDTLAAFMLLDLAIYAQHRLMHTLPVLWRLHRMHHSDLATDATTALRFHPLEIVLSMLWKMLVAVALGAPPAAVVAFEIALNATAMFNHANLALPPRLDRALRLLVVTPDMHRVHHSIHRDETDSNYGFNLPWWDRLFGSYCDQPRDGHDAMAIGLPQFRAAAAQRLPALLLQPLAPLRRRDGGALL